MITVNIQSWSYIFGESRYNEGHTYAHSKDTIRVMHMPTVKTQYGSNICPQPRHNTGHSYAHSKDTTRIQMY